MTFDEEKIEVGKMEKEISSDEWEELKIHDCDIYYPP
jgi:hypothetical protein